MNPRNHQQKASRDELMKLKRKKIIIRKKKWNKNNIG